MTESVGAYDPENTPGHVFVPGISHEPEVEFPTNPSPTGELLTNPDGSFQAYPPNPDGTPVRLSQPEMQE